MGIGRRSASSHEFGVAVGRNRLGDLAWESDVTGLGLNHRELDMAHDLMLDCEQRKEFRRPDGDVLEWRRVTVSSAVDVPRERLRCMHCHGAVRVHKQQVPDGPRDHVEHLLHQDSEHCRGGVYYDGHGQRRSTQPVE